MNLIIFSHSDYSVLWPILEESIENIQDINKVFVCNKTDLIKPKGFQKYIEYDDKKCYSKRWIEDILHIDKSYVLIIHDVQVIVNCDTKYILEIVELMEENNIDRCSLNVFNGKEIIGKNNVNLCNLNTAKGLTFTPYDTCPSIWKTKSFIKLWETFPNETYGSSELNANLQEFCKHNLKCFGLQKNNERIYYCLGRPFLKEFKILLITIKNEITFPKNVYMDMETEFTYYFEKYNLCEKIKINNNYGFVLNNFNKL